MNPIQVNSGRQGIFWNWSGELTRYYCEHCGKIVHYAMYAGKCSIDGKEVCKDHAFVIPITGKLICRGCYLTMMGFFGLIVLGLLLSIIAAIILGKEALMMGLFLIMMLVIAISSARSGKKNSDDPKKIFPETRGYVRSPEGGVQAGSLHVETGGNNNGHN